MVYSDDDGDGGSCNYAVEEERFGGIGCCVFSLLTWSHTKDIEKKKIQVI